MTLLLVHADRLMKICFSKIKSKSKNKFVIFIFDRGEIRNKNIMDTLGCCCIKVVKSVTYKFLFLFILTIFLSVSCSGTMGPTVPTNSYGSLARSVVVITREGRAVCTGFFISSDEIITAAHCLNEDRFSQSYEVVGYEQYLQDETLGTSDLFYVVEADYERDVALLRTWMAGAIDYNHTVVEIYSGNTPEVGSRTLSIGHPVGQLFTATTGFISRRPTVDPDTSVVFIHSNTPIYFGNSGGPLFDSSGRVIGMADAIVARQAFLGLFVSYSEIRDFLKEIGQQEFDGGAPLDGHI